MPLQVPVLDDRTHSQLVEETLARVPVHTPEWTNFNAGDPGVTLVELFAFLTENLLYRANQIPERNRKKFLSLLGLPLAPGSSAQGLVSFANERGELRAATFATGFEVRAGEVPFRTESGLEVLPIELAVFAKRRLAADTSTEQYYRELYRSFQQQDAPAHVQLYETTPLSGFGDSGVKVDEDTVDGSLWIALLQRPVDKPFAARRPAALEALAGRMLTLGLVPLVESTGLGRHLLPGGREERLREKVRVELVRDPVAPSREPRFQRLAEFEMPETPATVEIRLPERAALELRNELEPLEAGAGERPPGLEDTDAGERLITWLRVTWPTGSSARVGWLGGNCAAVSQRTRVQGEVLSPGTGAPDQSATLANRPVLPGTVRVWVQGFASAWEEIEDLFAAGPEVATTDPRQPPGVASPGVGPTNVFQLDAEAGSLRFGDGFRGRRLPPGTEVRVDYDFGAGSAGNVERGAIKSGVGLPPGFKVTNPVRTWGGGHAETVAAAEQRIPRYLQHRDRLVTAEDFETIAWQTPGIELGRVDVLPAYHPRLSPNEPGDAPGVVTLLVVPRRDPAHPEAPAPDSSFLNALCEYLEPRRLVTTELFLRGPTYVDLWLAIGFNAVAGRAFAEVRDEVEVAVRQFLSPLPLNPGPPADAPVLERETPEDLVRRRGWPLRKSITTGELMVIVSRVSGVASVNRVGLAVGEEAESATVDLSGLELPRIARLSVTEGEPITLKELRGRTAVSATGSDPQAPRSIAVPVIPREC